MASGDEPPSVSLEDLQGEWVASRGEAIKVEGVQLFINGNAMPGGLKMSADGKRVIGFSIYRVQPEETREGQVFWHAGPQELIWRRAAAGEVDKRVERMDTAIKSAGVGLAAASNTGGDGFSVNSELEAVARLNAVIEKWRIGPLTAVRSDDICPDWTNRSQTGLSVDHVHYIATLISRHGFKSRRRGLKTDQGAHDVPVLVRESADSELGKAVSEKWKEQLSIDGGFPPFLLEDKAVFYCSLGNGHFSQALNLFRTGMQSMWTDDKYSIGEDDALREAIDDGVESVVLSADMPLADRKFVSEMLNRAHGRQWKVGDDGRVSVDGEVPAISGTMFVALSKVLDAEELSCLVRQKLGVDVDRNIVKGVKKQAFDPITPVSRL